MEFPDTHSIWFNRLRKWHRLLSVLISTGLTITTCYPLTQLARDDVDGIGSPDVINHPVLPREAKTVGIWIGMATGVGVMLAVLVRSVYQSCRRRERDERWIRVVRVLWEGAVLVVAGVMLVYWRVRYRRRAHDGDIWAWTCTEEKYAREMPLDTGFKGFFGFHWGMYCGMLTAAYGFMGVLFVVQGVWVVTCFWLRNPCVRSKLR